MTHLSNENANNEGRRERLVCKEKSAKRKIDETLEEISNGHYDLSDDDDDSDWDPFENQAQVVQWFCVNCTMVNLSNAVHCYMCGEHKESGILRLGYYASPSLPMGDIIERELEATERSKGRDLQFAMNSMKCFSSKILH